MKKIFFLLFCLLVAAHSFFAQGSEKDTTTGSHSFRLAWKIAPLAFFTPQIGPSLRTGLEYRVKKNISFYNEIGVFVLESQGIAGTMEFKYYPKRTEHLGGFFVSGEVFCKSQYFRFREKFDGQYIRYNLNKNVGAITLRIGETICTRRGFLFEFFGGLGVRYAQNSNTLTPDQNRKFSKQLNENLIGKQQGERPYVNLEFGFRIGARLVK